MAVYNPLHPYGIRVAALKPKSESTDISFSVACFYLDDAPPYKALSYCWVTAATASISSRMTPRLC